jgi:hypothetical protein
LVHEVLDVADVGVADAIALAASSTVDAEKRACGLLANGGSRDTTGVYSVSTVLQTRPNEILTRRQGRDEESPGEHKGHHLSEDVELHGGCCSGCTN